MLTFQLHGPAFQGGDLFYDILVFQKFGEALVACSIQGSGPEGETGQGVAPGPAVELIV